jgi:hypothetical protein
MIHRTKGAPFPCLMWEAAFHCLRSSFFIFFQIGFMEGLVGWCNLVYNSHEQRKIED